MLLYFIRHAESENNALWTQTASSEGRVDDPELTDLGREQAKLAAALLAGENQTPPYLQDDPFDGLGFKITHLYSSLMWRALSTAQIIARAIQRPILGQAEIHEGGGVWLADEESGEFVGLPGKSPSALKKAFPELTLPENLNPEGWWSKPFEPFEERMPRAHRVLSWLMAQHGGRDDRVAFVSHVAFYNYFMSAVFGSQERLQVWFNLNNCGITKLHFQNGEVQIIYSNRLDHLSPEKIS